MADAPTQSQPLQSSPELAKHPLEPQPRLGHNGGPPLDDYTYTIASDRLRGASEIAAFRGEGLLKTYRDLENGRIPAGRDGNVWVASKRVLREHFDQLARGLITMPPQRYRRADDPAPPSTPPQLTPPPIAPEPSPRRRVGRPRKIRASSSSTSAPPPLAAKPDDE
jgi:hypothetical protein